MRDRPLSHFLKIAAIAVIGVVSSLSYAQENQMQNESMSGEPSQRVEVTGSAIRRIPKEGSIPVQIYTQEDIQKTGAQNASDFIQMLPAMQGYTVSAASVNGGGGGQVTASLHSVGEKYTLVLIDGRRLAKNSSVGGTSAVNLGALPLAAVDRVEVLTDGASALYGSDAIAGVVNFILKKKTEEGQVTASYNAPFRAGGGTSWDASVYKGFGDFEKNGYNAFLSYQHSEQRALDASRRGFAQSGVVPFSVHGQKYVLFQLSSNTSPAGVTLRHADGSVTQFSPDFYANGKCGPNTILVGNYCKFDYAATVQILPKTVRDDWTASLNYKVNSNINVFADALLSRYDVKSKYAPPAQGLSLKTTDALYTKYVTPYLATLNEDATKITSASMNLRLVDAGGREDLYRTDAQHFVLGMEGNAWKWDYNFAYVHSINKWSDIAEGGYASANTLATIQSAGTFDPFAPAGKSVGIVAPAVLHQTLDHGYTSIDVFAFHGGRDLFKTPGGTSQLGLGIESLSEIYNDEPSAILQSTNPLQPNYTDGIIGGGSGALPFKASRLNYGAFAEVLVPIIHKLEATGSLRYDHYDKVHNSTNFDLNANPIKSAKQGRVAEDFTYKLSSRWQPVNMLLVRGSYGTGFRAPLLTDIANPTQLFGVTNGTYNCPVKAPDPNAQYCQGSAQYDLLTGGNSSSGKNGLKPETSTQATIGARVEPIQSLSMGLDYWQVRIKNQIGVLQESLAFNNPSIYSGNFIPYNDTLQGQTVIAFKQTPINLNTATYKGLDWDASYGLGTPIGKMNFLWNASYMIEAQQDYPGVGKQSSLGIFGPDNKVVSKFLSRFEINLKQSDMWKHLLAMNYRSAYKDQGYAASDSAVKVVNADGTYGAFVDMHDHIVKAYTTYDWQTEFSWKTMIARVGIKNLMDAKPPLSILNVGSGNQVGYDGRYADPLGRQYYATLAYKF